MRYELSDYEWAAIKPMLPNKPRGVRRVNDRRVLNGIFWVLRSGAPWRASNVGVSRPDTTNSRPTIWPSSNSHQSAFGCALMSPRP
jgi:transposase